MHYSFSAHTRSREPFPACRLPARVQDGSDGEPGVDGDGYGLRGAGEEGGVDGDGYADDFDDDFDGDPLELRPSDGEQIDRDNRITTPYMTKCDARAPAPRAAAHTAARACRAR